MGKLLIAYSDDGLGRGKRREILMRGLAFSEDDGRIEKRRRRIEKEEEENFRTSMSKAFKPMMR